MVATSDVVCCCGYSTRPRNLGHWLSVSLTVWVLSRPQFATASGIQVVFSLDNRPQAPISIDPLGFGNGAEDPYQHVSSPTFVGPSPTLNTFLPSPVGRTLSDADILTPGNPLVNPPAVDARRLPAQITSMRSVAIVRLLTAGRCYWRLALIAPAWVSRSRRSVFSFFEISSLATFFFRHEFSRLPASLWRRSSELVGGATCRALAAAARTCS